jgi:hypothetical protein
MGAEGVPGVRRHHYTVSGFRDDVDTIDRVDASSFVHNEHLAAGVAMLRRAHAMRIAAHQDEHVDTVEVAAKGPT